MASSQLCERCSRATKYTVAVKYCSDCEESLCPDCFSVHGTFKGFMSHHVIDAQVSADISFGLNKLCSDHQDMVLDLYCSDHDDICCKSCIADEHRTCGKIKPLDVAAKGVKSASMLEDFASEGSLITIGVIVFCLPNYNKSNCFYLLNYNRSKRILSP